MKALAAVGLVVAVAAAGCASSRSVLYSGISPPLGGKKIVVTDAAAVRAGRSTRGEWLAMLPREAHAAPGLHFSSLSQHEFRQRLAGLSSRYGFVVKEVQFLHRALPTPLVVVQTSHYVPFAKALRAIEASLDPHTAKSDLRGWAFRGFYVEALDERGVPFLVADNVVGNGVAGGQWARADALYPFQHG